MPAALEMYCWPIKTLLYDELRRLFQADRALFANTTTAGTDGPLTPGDGQVTTRYEYDSNSRVNRILNDNANQDVYEYDGIDRRIRLVDQLGNELLTEYDDNHNATRVIEIEKSPESTVADENFVTQHQYDSIDRRTVLIDNLGNTAALSYDSRNNVTQIVDQLGNTRIYSWDGINRKLAEVHELRQGGTGGGSIDTSNLANADGQISRLFNWDDNNRLLAESDDNGNTTSYAYDNLNRRALETFADSTTNTYVFDRDDNIVGFTDENGSVHADEYDGINRLTGKSVTPAAGIEGTTAWDYEYDGLSRLTRGTDNNDPNDVTDDSVVTFEYDSLSRQLIETQNGETIARTLDGVGNRLSLIYPSGRQINATFDGLERIDALTDADGDRLIADYDYIGPYRVLERRYGNGTRLTYHDDSGNDVGYDGLKRPIGIFHRRADDSLIAGFEHAFDKQDNRRFEKDLFRDTADAFEYDSVYRVTRAALDLPATAVSGIINNATTNADVASLTSPQETAYRLDGVGNWAQRDRDGTVTAYTANEMNEYAAIGAAAQVHDDNGNLTDDGESVFKYDFANRLVSIEDGSGNDIAGYTYDAIGRRVAKEVGATTTTFYYDMRHSIEERDSTNAVLRQFVFGPSIDEVLELTTANNDRYFYHQNYLLSTEALTDSAGNVAERYDYREYGETKILAADGLTEQTSSVIDNPFRYTGRRFDDESDLYYYRARFYDPERGRFLQRDPKGYIDGMGPYAYAKANPLRWRDPSGMKAKENLFSDGYCLSGDNRHHYQWCKNQGRLPALELEAADDEGRIKIDQLIAACGEGGHLEGRCNFMLTDDVVAFHQNRLAEYLPCWFGKVLCVDGPSHVIKVTVLEAGPISQFEIDTQYPSLASYEFIFNAETLFDMTNHETLGGTYNVCDNSLDSACHKDIDVMLTWQVHGTSPGANPPLTVSIPISPIFDIYLDIPIGIAIEGGEGIPEKISICVSDLAECTKDILGL